MGKSIGIDLCDDYAAIHIFGEEEVTVIPAVVSKEKKGGGLWMVGFGLNSISFEKDLWDNEELDKFCKKMEDSFAEISEFYSRCSQKLNEAAELKNFGRGIIDL